MNPTTDSATRTADAKSDFESARIETPEPAQAEKKFPIGDIASDSTFEPTETLHAETLHAETLHAETLHAETPHAETPHAKTLHAEDLAVGDQWETEWREITDADVHGFATLTGDHTPLHGDDGSNSPYGKPIAHGLLGLSVLAGLGTNHPKASTLAFVSVENWQFLAPVFFGDKVRARNEIVAIDPHGRRAVKVRWLRQLINETGRVTQEGYFVTLVASRKRGAKKPR